MRCYKCNSKLDESRDICSKCGTDIRYFKKIVYASNRYYNEGLLKAEARDLSGARDALKKSLHLYKKNTNARNLYGLVCYAMGESAEALKEWVLSKNISPDNNAADRYINGMKRNMRDLNSEGHGIKKYNQALNYARTGANDLAMIQLKKVVSVHSNMTKAYELLALLYIEDQKYDQAAAVLKRCLEVDRGNVSALYYLKELRRINERNKAKSAGTVGNDEREQLIIPIRFRDYGSYLSNALYILGGLLLGVLIAWFVIVPGRVEEETGDVVMQARSYEEQISELQQKVQGNKIEESVEALQKEQDKESKEESRDESVAESVSESEEETLALRVNELTSWVANQNALLDAVAAHEKNNLPLFADLFLSVNPTLISGNYQEHYINLLGIAGDKGVYNQLIGTGDQAYANGDFKRAAKNFDAAAKLWPGEAEARYKAGLAYEGDGNKEKAANRFLQVALVFPDSQFAADSEKRYKENKGTDEMPAPLKKEEREALSAPIDCAALRKAMEDSNP